MKSKIVMEFDECKATLEALKEQIQDTLPAVIHTITSALQRGNKVLVMGNGGSAADSQHMAAELVGRYKQERRAIPCIALTTDTSILTALANDYSFDEIFSRQIQALAVKGDVCIAISTSGNSPNILKGIEKAGEMGCTVIALGGKDGGEMKKIAHHAIIVPSHNTPRIQEGHSLLIHILCHFVEQYFTEEERV